MIHLFSSIDQLIAILSYISLAHLKQQNTKNIICRMKRASSSLKHYHFSFDGCMRTKIKPNLRNNIQYNDVTLIKHTFSHIYVHQNQSREIIKETYCISCSVRLTHFLYVSVQDTRSKWEKLHTHTFMNEFSIFIHESVNTNHQAFPPIHMPSKRKVYKKNSFQHHFCVSVQPHG